MKFKPFASLLLLLLCLFSINRALAQINSKPLLAITYSKLQFEEGDVLGIVNKKPFKYLKSKNHRDLGFKNVVHNYIIEGFELANYDVIDEAQLKKQISRIVSPKVVVACEISALDFNFSGKYLKEYAGVIRMSGNWNLYPSAGEREIVHQIPFEVNVQRLMGSNEYILAEPLRVAAQELAEDNEFLSYVSEMESNHFSASRGSIIEMKQIGGYTIIDGKANIQRAITAVFTIKSDQGIGSAILISSSGYLVTNNHVIDEAKQLEAISNSGASYEVDVIKKNPDYDMALLKIECDSIEPLIFSASKKIEIGEKVYAIGTPLYSELGQSVSSGIVSGVRKLPYMQIIQTDVSINPGNSGGALMDENGQVIGITTFKLSQEYAEGIGFCIPAYEAIKALNIKFRP